MQKLCQYPELFTPVTIRGKVYRNRLIGAPVGAGRLTKGQQPSEHTLAEIRSRAENMAAYVVGETDVSAIGTRSFELANAYDFRDLSPENLLPYRAMAQTIHDCGAVAEIEIAHCGGSKVLETGYPAYGPSAFVNSRGIQVHQLTREMIRQTVQDFADCAYFMKCAGFDGVMGHFGHGWLITQFLSPITNLRTDEYGGGLDVHSQKSLENRCRFPLEVLTAIREACGEDFIIDMRCSGEEQVPGGYGVEDFLAFCRLADPLVDLINVSEGHYREPVASRLFPGMYAPRACNAEIAERVMGVVRHARVSVVGAINSPALCQKIIAGGQADFVLMCRQLTADHDFAKKLLEGRAEEIRPCTYCFTCFPGPAEDVGTDPDEEPGPMGCPLAAPMGYESFPPAEELKNLLVVGGGIAGMQAAYQAASRGHRVTLLEKSDRLGGILNCVRPDTHKEGFTRYLDSMAASVRRSGVDVRLNTVLTPELAAALKPDAAFLAVGGSPVTAGIPGMDGKNVMPAVGAMERLPEIGRRVVVIGGGLIGCELAVYLHQQGRQVTLVVRSKLAKNAPKLHRMGIQLELQKGVEVLQPCRTLEITPEGVWVLPQDGEKRLLRTDTVLCALGLVPNTAAVEAARACLPGVSIEILGDCGQIGRIYDANQAAWKAACHLGTAYRPPIPAFGPPGMGEKPGIPKS